MFRSNKFNISKIKEIKKNVSNLYLPDMEKECGEVFKNEKYENEINNIKKHIESKLSTSYFLKQLLDDNKKDDYNILQEHSRVLFYIFTQFIYMFLKYDPKKDLKSFDELSIKLSNYLKDNNNYRLLFNDLFQSYSTDLTDFDKHNDEFQKNFEILTKIDIDEQILKQVTPSLNSISKIETTQPFMCQDVIESRTSQLNFFRKPKRKNQVEPYQNTINSSVPQVNELLTLPKEQTDEKNYNFPGHDGSVSLPSGWSLVTDKDGAIYYWNRDTDQVTWNIPKEQVSPDTTMSLLPQDSTTDSSIQEQSPDKLIVDNILNAIFKSIDIIQLLDNFMNIKKKLCSLNNDNKEEIENIIELLNKMSANIGVYCIIKNRNNGQDKYDIYSKSCKAMMPIEQRSYIDEFEQLNNILKKRYKDKYELNEEKKLIGGLKKKSIKRRKIRKQTRRKSIK